MSLDPADRHMLVRQTAETWLGSHDTPIAPVPVGGAGPVALRARRLARPARRLDDEAVLAGRDAVDPRLGPRRADGPRPVRPRRLPRLPLPVRTPDRAGEGHRAQDEGRLAFASPASTSGSSWSSASRCGRTPTRTTSRSSRSAIRPLVTPTAGRSRHQARTQFFWPKVGGQLFDFTLDALDHDEPAGPAASHRCSGSPRPSAQPLTTAGRRRRTTRARTGRSRHSARRSRSRPVQKGGDTVLETVSISLRGKARARRLAAAHEPGEGVGCPRCSSCRPPARSRSSTTRSTSRGGFTSAEQQRARSGRRFRSTPPSASIRPTTSSRCRS